MPVCASGSQPKSTSPAHVYIDPLYARSLLPAALSWLVPYLPYIPPIDIDTNALCTIDPPADPGITLEDLVNLMLGPNKPTLAFIAGQKLAQLVHIYLWYSLCECVSGTTPAAPSPPSQPAGAPQINPPGVVSPPPVSSCGSYAGGPVPLSTGINWTALVGGTPPDLNSLDTCAVGVPVPAGATSVRLSYINTGGTASNDQIRFYFNTYAADCSRISITDNDAPAGNATITKIVTVPSTAVWFSLHAVQIFNPRSTNLVKATADFYCGGANPNQAGAVSCCPPDPILMGMLSQILNTVTVLQRFRVPYASMAGATHPGLSGTGEITIPNGLLGLRVDVTTLPGSIGHLTGTPARLFDAGWVGVGDGSSYQRTAEITTDPFLWFPSGMPAMTRLGYTLAPNVVVSITEIEAET